MASWEATKREVWERDRGVCQGCGKNLLVQERVSDGLRSAHAALKVIPVYQWEELCYFCKKPTPIVTYSFSFNHNYSVGDVPALDDQLGKNYPWVRPEPSKTQGATVICNTCLYTDCGRIAMGNHYVMEALVEFEVAGELADLRVGVIPNVTSPEDFAELREDRIEVHRSPDGRVHRLVENDDQLSNLVLLCRRCDTAWRRQRRKADA